MVRRDCRCHCVCFVNVFSTLYPFVNLFNTFHTFHIPSNWVFDLFILCCVESALIRDVHMIIEGQGSKSGKGSTYHIFFKL